MNPLHIALISEHASPLALLGGVDSGGQNVYVAQVARHLARLGHRVDVFTRRDDEHLPEVLEWEPGVRVIHVPAGPAVVVPKEQLLGYMPAFTEWMHTWICEAHTVYNLIHANFWMSALVAAELKQQTGLPFAVTFHALGKVRRQHQGANDGFPDARFAIEERAVREADLLIAEAPQDEADLVALYAADPARIRLVPCGFDPDEFAPQDKISARQKLGLPTDERIVLQLGRMVPRKGVENVVRGVARLRHAHGIAARLVIVGGESEAPDPVFTPEIGRLQTIAAAENIAESVTFVGRRGRRALADYYAAADLFVSTPWYEPFGITPLEAMACATPVVGSRVGGIQYTVVDGETGYLVPPKDADALGERLAQLFREPALIERFGQQGLARVHQHFTWEKVAASLADAFAEISVPHRLLASRGATPPPLAQPLPIEQRSAAPPALPLAAHRRGLHTNGHPAVHRSGHHPAYASNNHCSPAHGAPNFSLDINAIHHIERAFDENMAAVQRARRALPRDIARAAMVLGRCFALGGKVLICGNGGSAAESQHMAAELVGRFQIKERRGLPALALTADTALLTAWSNDIGYEDIFARQVHAFGQPGDVLVGLSTSGRSRNVCCAFAAARERGLTTVALLGGSGGEIAQLADIAVTVPAARATRVQEVQLLALHLICELVEDGMEELVEQSQPELVADKDF